jgi:enoyl-CoA hydratase
MSEYTNVLIERADALATVTVSRPERLNVLNADTVAALGAAFAELAADDGVRGIVLTGAGEKAFVAGADIGELAGMAGLSGEAFSRRGQDVFRAIERMRKPVVAAVNGFALGGGLELALACHLRVASENARFGLPEVKLGIIPGYGGTVRLPRLVGRGRALQMILTGEAIEAAEAQRIGLVNDVVPLPALLDAACGLARRIMQNGPLAIGMALEAVDAGYGATTEEALRHEAGLFGLLAATEDMREGMAAFLEKRSPLFRGR